MPKKCSLTFDSKEGCGAVSVEKIVTKIKWYIIINVASAYNFLIVRKSAKVPITFYL